MYIILMLLLISLLILVHELGHFTVARLLGIQVERFGFGLPFGPILWEKKIGEVTYCVHAFLLGGYVSFPDDDPDSELAEDDPRRLKNKKTWEKAAVISAGVVANFVFAFIIIIGVALVTGGVPTNKHKIFIEQLDTETVIAKQAGFKEGDQIVAIDNRDIESYQAFVKMLKANKANDQYVLTQDAREQTKQILQANPKLLKGWGYDPNNLSDADLNKLSTYVVPNDRLIDVPKAKPETTLVPDLDDPFTSPEFLGDEYKLSEDLVALKTAAKNGNFVGNGSTTFAELGRATADTKHKLNITVLRDGENQTIALSPNDKGIIGVRAKLEEINMPVNSPQTMISASWAYTSRVTMFMVTGLYKIATGQVDLRNLHGIVAITKIGGDVIKDKGMVDGWLLTALISIDLAIVNLLPIPALDGGHLMFLFIEKLRGRPIDEKIQENIAKYGFLFLIGLMVLIIFNDIIGIVQDKF